MGLGLRVGLLGVVMVVEVEYLWDDFNLHFVFLRSLDFASACEALTWLQ